MALWAVMSPWPQTHAQYWFISPLYTHTHHHIPTHPHLHYFVYRLPNLALFLRTAKCHQKWVIPCQSSMTSNHQNIMTYMRVLNAAAAELPSASTSGYRDTCQSHGTTRCNNMVQYIRTYICTYILTYVDEYLTSSCKFTSSNMYTCTQVADGTPVWPSWRHAADALFICWINCHCMQRFITMTMNPLNNKGQIPTYAHTTNTRWNMYTIEGTLILSNYVPVNLSMRPTNCIPCRTSYSPQTLATHRYAVILYCYRKLTRCVNTKLVECMNAPHPLCVATVGFSMKTQMAQLYQICFDEWIVSTLPCQTQKEINVCHALFRCLLVLLWLTVIESTIFLVSRNTFS